MCPKATQRNEAHRRRTEETWKQHEKEKEKWRAVASQGYIADVAADRCMCVRVCVCVACVVESMSIVNCGLCIAINASLAVEGRVARTGRLNGAHHHAALKDRPFSSHTWHYVCSLSPRRPPPLLHAFHSLVSHFSPSDEARRTFGLIAEAVCCTSRSERGFTSSYPPVRRERQGPRDGAALPTTHSLFSRRLSEEGE
jgi:hypothetical protein